MKYTLYSTHCPKCKVVELKLTQANIDFDTIDNVDTIIKIGEDHDILSAPILQVDDNYYDFTAAVKFLKERIAK